MAQQKTLAQQGHDSSQLGATLLQALTMSYCCRPTDATMRQACTGIAAKCCFPAVFPLLVGGLSLSTKCSGWWHRRQTDALLGH